MEASGFTDQCATLWQEQLFRLLYLKGTCWKTLPLRLMRQPFRKEPLPAVGAWSLLLPHRPFLVVNMALFSQTKQGPFQGVARHTVWGAQTFLLQTGQPSLAVSSPCFTLLCVCVCVFLPTPLGKLPCFMAICRWQGISHQDWNLPLSPKLPTLLRSRTLRWGSLFLRRTVVISSWLWKTNAHVYSPKRQPQTFGV